MIVKYCKNKRNQRMQIFGNNKYFKKNKLKINQHNNKNINNNFINSNKIKIIIEIVKIIIRRPN